MPIEEIIFESCHSINNLLESGDDNGAREELIKLLDLHKKNDVTYSSTVNHFIRLTGLFPYLQEETSNWQERYIYDVFKVNYSVAITCILRNAGNHSIKSMHKKSWPLRGIMSARTIANIIPN